jgi:hypothetical protein
MGFESENTKEARALCRAICEEIKLSIVVLGVDLSDKFNLRVAHFYKLLAPEVVEELEVSSWEQKFSVEADWLEESETAEATAGNVLGSKVMDRGLLSTEWTQAKMDFELPMDLEIPEALWLQGSAQMEGWHSEHNPEQIGGQYPLTERVMSEMMNSGILLPMRGFSFREGFVAVVDGFKGAFSTDWANNRVVMKSGANLFLSPQISCDPSQVWFRVCDSGSEEWVSFNLEAQQGHDLPKYQAMPRRSKSSRKRLEGSEFDWLKSAARILDSESTEAWNVEGLLDEVDKSKAKSLIRKWSQSAGASEEVEVKRRVMFDPTVARFTHGVHQLERLIDQDKLEVKYEDVGLKDSSRKILSKSVQSMGCLLKGLYKMPPVSLEGWQLQLETCTRVDEEGLEVSVKLSEQLLTVLEEMTVEERKKLKVKPEEIESIRSMMMAQGFAAATKGVRTWLKGKDPGLHEALSLLDIVAKPSNVNHHIGLTVVGSEYCVDCFARDPLQEEVRPWRGQMLDWLRCVSESPLRENKSLSMGVWDVTKEGAEDSLGLLKLFKKTCDIRLKGEDRKVMKWRMEREKMRELAFQLQGLEIGVGVVFEMGIELRVTFHSAVAEARQLGVKKSSDAAVAVRKGAGMTCRHILGDPLAQYDKSEIKVVERSPTVLLRPNDDKSVTPDGGVLFSKSWVDLQSLIVNSNLECEIVY